jgi:hypothetical protein
VVSGLRCDERGVLTRELMRATGLTAEEAIATYKHATIRRVFPGQYYQSTIDEIEAAAEAGERAARTALKLLFDRRFDK